MLLMAERIFVRLNEALVVMLMMAMTSLVLLNVVTRYAFSFSVTWAEELSRFLMRRSATLRFGLVGYGKIARAFHRKIAALGVREVLVNDPALKQAPPGVELAALPRLFSEADVVSLHAPLTPHNHHLIGAALLARLRPGAIFINTARGALVDEHALLSVLRAGHIRAGLDVFEHEPPAASHPFFTLDHVILSDHTAWYSDASIDELQRGAAQEVARVFAGETPHAWVNRWQGAA